jgi:hypothetical protein
MKKSSACGNSNSCVFVGLAPNGKVRVATDESPLPGSVIYFTREEWDAFIKGVQRGEFEYDRLSKS